MAETFAKDLGIRVHKLTCLMGRSAERVLRAMGNLTFAQFRILLALGHGAKLNQRTIAQFQGITEAAVSRMLATMQQRKLVYVVHDPANRRAHTLALTPQGKRVVESAMRVLETHFTKVTRRIPLAQRHALFHTLDTIINGLTA